LCVIDGNYSSLGFLHVPKTEIICLAILPEKWKILDKDRYGMLIVRIFSWITMSLGLAFMMFVEESEMLIWDSVIQNTYFGYKPVLSRSRSQKKRVRISSTFSLLRPVSYLQPFLYFDSRTSTSLLRLSYFDLQIWTSYWSRRTGRSTVLIEVKYGQKSRSKVLPKKSK